MSGKKTWLKVAPASPRCIHSGSPGRASPVYEHHDDEDHDDNDDDDDDNFDDNEDDDDDENSVPLQ